jgi:dipeptidyl aminopeptidase/acylaminoacyl peptidase
MILPAATVLFLLAQTLAVPRPDGGTGAPRAISAFPVESAPGLPRVQVSGVPAVPADFEAWLAPYTEARSAQLADPGEDGKAVLILTRFGSVTQIHRVAAPLGMREQLSFGKEPVAKAAWLPGDARTVFFLQDSGGGENFQLYRLDTRTGRRQLLTDGKSRHETFSLSPDGRWLAYSGTGRNGTDTDVYLAETASPSTARRLTEESGNWVPGEFSADGKKLLVRRERAIDDADLFVVDVTNRTRTRITPDPATAGKGSVRKAAFGPEGKSVFLVTDRGVEFSQLFRVDLTRPDAPWMPLTADLKWNVEGLAVARDGTVAFAVNEDGYSKVYLLRRGATSRTLVDLPAGVVGDLRFPSRTSDVVSLTLDTPTSPGDVWQVKVKGGAPLRWTRSEIGGMDPAQLARPELVRYPSTDGFTVPAFLYRPHGLRPGARAPVVVVWHGGPESQERPKFYAFAQALTDLGIAVLLPNVRGSDGYGKAYLAADDGVKREQALKDIGATLDFIGRQPDLDSSRVAAYGGSYGGYMTLASVAFYPERFRAAVDVVGISSFPTFLSGTATYRRDLRRAEYGDDRDPEVRKVLERISPLNSAGNIRVALYVLQGKNDPRVPQGEAEQIVRAVRDHGKTAWYMLALDEGHGFKKKETRDYAWSTMLYFLREQLVGGGVGPAGGR